MRHPTAHIREDAFIGEGTVKVKVKGREELGVFELGNATEFSVSMSSEVLERISKKRGTYGQVLNTITLPKAGELSITIDTINKETFAMALMGSLGVDDMKAETIADEEIDFKPDVWLKLPHRYIDGEVVVKDASAASTVDDKEVEVEPRLGLFRVTAAGAAAANIEGTVKVSYKTATWTRWVIQAFKATELRGELWLDGKNRITGEDVLLHMPQFTLAVDGEFNFFTDEFNTITFKGRPETAEGYETAFTVEMKE